MGILRVTHNNTKNEERRIQSRKATLLFSAGFSHRRRGVFALLGDFCMCIFFFHIQISIRNPHKICFKRHVATRSHRIPRGVSSPPKLPKAWKRQRSRTLSRLISAPRSSSRSAPHGTAHQPVLSVAKKNKRGEGGKKLLESGGGLRAFQGGGGGRKLCSTHGCERSRRTIPNGEGKEKNCCASRTKTLYFCWLPRPRDGMKRMSRKFRQSERARKSRACHDRLLLVCLETQA